MKKIILSAALLLNCLLKAQLVVPAAILNVTPRTVCPGDSVVVEFSLQGTVAIAVPFEVAITLQNGAIAINDTVAFAGRLVDLFASGVLPSGDSTYHFKQFVPYGLPAGQTCIDAQVFIDEANHCVTISRECEVHSNPCDTMPVMAISLLGYTVCVPCTNIPGQSTIIAERITPYNVDTTTTVFTIDGGPPTLTATLWWTPNLPGVTHFTLTGISYMADSKACYQSLIWTITTILCDFGTPCYSVTSIQELQPDVNNFTPFYFNFIGQPISGPLSEHIGELLIEQRGVIRKKIKVEPN